MVYLKLVLYTILLNIIRYFPGGIIETYTIFEAMHRPMQQYPDCFGFAQSDLPSSYLYNFILWFSVIVIFHISHNQINGKMLYKSLKIFGICGILYLSLAAVYMNHFVHGIRVFFVYSMLDGVILLIFLGIINGFLYPLVFKK